MKHYRSIVSVFLSFALALAPATLTMGCGDGAGSDVYASVMNQISGQPDVSIPMPDDGYNEDSKNEGIINQDDSGADGSGQSGAGEHSSNQGGSGQANVPGAGQGAPGSGPQGSATRQSLTLYVSEGNKPLMQKLIRAFRKQRSGVDINVETYSYTDVRERNSSIMTRLLSDPPDIIDTSDLNNAKLDEESLFVDLNPLLDGPGGVDRSGFFDNIIRACINNGGLYHVPLMFTFTMFSLNKQYMTEINASTDAMTTLNYPQLLDYWKKAASIHLGDEIYLFFNHTVLSALNQNWSGIMDIRARTVNVDNPQNRDFLESARLVPSKYTMTPEGARADYTSSNINEELFVVTDKYIAFEYNGFFMSYISFLSDLPNVKYGNPLLSAAADGSVPFWPILNLSVSRSCAEKELAWEFVRFCLEYSDSTYDLSDASDVASRLYVPVNKEKFRNQFAEILDVSYADCVALKYLVPGEDKAEAANEKRRALDSVISMYMKFAGLCDKEQLSDANAGRLIYDDLYQYYAGYQSAEAALRNIQNRLELYVNE